MSSRKFPILDGKSIKSIPWEVIAPHDTQAQRNHGQTLERLAERGGLSAYEAVCVLTDRRFREVPHKDDDYHESELREGLRRGLFLHEESNDG